MPDIPETAAEITLPFLRQEILPFLAKHLHPSVLSAELPPITYFREFDAWKEHVLKLEERTDPANIVNLQAVTVNSDEAPVPPGLYFQPDGWNIYTLVHELTHWYDYMVIPRHTPLKTAGPRRGEFIAYSMELLFLRKYPDYKPMKPVVLEIPDVRESLEARIKSEFEREMFIEIVRAMRSGRYHASKSISDILIAGAGPAGLSCAINAASEGASVVLAEAGMLGGQSVESFAIENYAGFPNGLTGRELASHMVQQASRFQAGLETASRLAAISRTRRGFLSTTTDGTKHLSRTVVLSVGVQYRRLGAFDTWAGQGLSYGMAYPCGERVVVVGGANSAGQAAFGLASQGKTVTLLSRSPLTARMSAYLCDKVRAVGVTVREHCELVGLEGFPLHSATTTDGDTFPVDNVLLYLGAVPHTAWLSRAIVRDAHGFLTAPQYQTSVPGLFAIGDVRSGSVKRIAAAVGEGSSVVPSIHSYIRSL